MARWKLMTSHYLKVPGVEWELQQTSQQTGKTIRKRYPVPQLLNPEDASDQNYPGEIIVCWEGKGEPRDIIFEGEPTADMEPVDSEAVAISKSLEAKWKHPIETLQGQGGLGGFLVADLQKQLEAAIRNAAQAVAAPTASLGGVSMEAFTALQEQVRQLMEANLALQQQQLAQDEQVVDDLEPLPPEAPIPELPKAERRV